MVEENYNAPELDEIVLSLKNDILSSSDGVGNGESETLSFEDWN